MDNTVLPVQWGVRPAFPLAGLVLAVALTAWAFLAAQPEDRLVAGAGAAILFLAAVSLWALRRRFTIDANGFVLRGVFSFRAVGWSQVVAVSAPDRRRRGMTSTSLEIDLEDECLVLLSRVELGQDPGEVARVVAATWVRFRSSN